MDPRISSTDFGLRLSLSNETATCTTGLTHIRRSHWWRTRVFAFASLPKVHGRLNRDLWASRKAEEGAHVQKTTSMCRCVPPVVHDLGRLLTVGAEAPASAIKDVRPG